jgi:hypothetical protein
MDIDLFLKAGWRQGAFLPKALTLELVSELGLAMDPENGDRILVIAHDCDINSKNLLAEPNAELILARKAVPDGNKRMGKSSRFLQLKVELVGDIAYVELKALEKFTIARDRLANHVVTEYLSDENIKFLSEWLARRYERAAFPNSFDRKIERVKDKIKKCLEPAAGDIYSIQFALGRDGEISDEEDYEVLGYALMLDEDYKDLVKRGACQKVVVKLQALLNDVGIVFPEDEDIRVVSIQDFSVEDLRLTKRWDWNVLSYDGGHEGYIVR